MTIQVMNGLVYGGMLYILSVGLVLIFGLRRVVNFAHGALFMLGAYVGYSAALIGGFWFGIIISVLALSIVGLVLDRFVFRPLQGQDPMITVLVTFGLLMVLEDFVSTVWGSGILSFPVPPSLAGTVGLAGVDFPIYRIFVIATALLVVGCLSFWLKFSNAGLLVRASSVDPVATAVQGVNTDRLSLIVISMGTALAGLSGVVAGPLIALSPSMGSTVLIDCFIVVVIGGLGSFSGAFVAALVVGLVHNFGIVYLPNFSSMLPLLLMVGVLIARPARVV